MKFRIALAAVALLVIGMSGVASAQATTGDLVLVHGIPNGASVNLSVKPQGGGADIALGTVLAGDSIRKPLPAGTHILVAVIPTLNITLNQQFTIVVNSTTTVNATLSGTTPSLGVSQPVQDDDDDDAETVTPRPQTVTVPTRVETGAGGTADDGARTLVLGGLAAAVAAGALTLGLRRRSAA